MYVYYHVSSDYIYYKVINLQSRRDLVKIIKICFANVCTDPLYVFHIFTKKSVLLFYIELVSDDETTITMKLFMPINKVNSGLQFHSDSAKFKVAVTSLMPS